MSPSAGKNRRLKQAKEEAQAEIEQYRLQREKEFKTKEAAVSWWRPLRQHAAFKISHFHFSLLGVNVFAEVAVF